MKLMLILLLLITSLMAVVGAFLTTSVSSFYIDTFYQQINEVFGEDSGDFIATLRSSADLPDGAEQIRLLVDTRAGELGIDYRTRNYFVLDGETGAFLAGSTDSSELPREQTANLLTARNAVAQRDDTLVGDESDMGYTYNMVQGVKEMQRTGGRGRVRDRVAAFCVDQSIEVGDEPYTFNNTWWAGISRYLVLHDPTLLEDPIRFRDSDIDCYGLLPVSYLPEIEPNIEVS